MAMLIISIVSLACGVLTYVPALSWLSFLGLTAGAMAWAWGVQMRYAAPPSPYRKATCILGIVGTFLGLAGILLAFTLGSLFYGGVMLF